MNKRAARRELQAGEREAHTPSPILHAPNSCPRLPLVKPDRRQRQREPTDVAPQGSLPGTEQAGDGCGKVTGETWPGASEFPQRASPAKTTACWTPVLGLGARALPVFADKGPHMRYLLGSSPLPCPLVPPASVHISDLSQPLHPPLLWS